MRHCHCAIGGRHRSARAEWSHVQAERFEFSVIGGKLKVIDRPDATEGERWFEFVAIGAFVARARTLRC